MCKYEAAETLLENVAKLSQALAPAQLAGLVSHNVT